MREKIAAMLIPYMRNSERYALADAVLEAILRELPVKKTKLGKNELTKEGIDYYTGFNEAIAEMQAKLREE